jgi:hypothetical protein
MKTTSRPRVDYHSYFTSSAWRARHPDWLNAVGNRCTLFPWLKIGHGRLYAIHHLHYRNLGNERLGRDVLPLSKFAHQRIIHGLLSGDKSAAEQRRYPNLAQQLVHEWMRQRLWFKACLVVTIASSIVVLIIGH